MLCSDEKRFNKRVELITYLLSEAPGLLTLQNSNGQTPLCLGCKEAAHHELITMLVRRNPQMVNVTDNEGRSPLHYGKFEDIIYSLCITIKY